MATITINGLSNTQARIIFEELENNWDDFNMLLNKNEIKTIDLDNSDIITDNEGDNNYLLTFCDSEDLGIEEEELEDGDIPDTGEDEDEHLY